VNALYAKKLPFNNPRRDGICGTGKQHDAHEFLDYIFNVIFDELNIHRDKPDYQLTSPDPKLQRMSTIQSCIHEWKRYGESHQSALSDRFSGLVCESLQCSHCPYTNRQFTSFGGYYTIYFPSKYHQSPPAFDTPTRVGIRELLEDTNNFGRKSEKINEWKCETCGNHQGIKSTKFAYLPEYLVFHFSRFGAGLSSSKVKTHIDLSSLDVDMGPFHITADDDVQADPGYDAGFQKVQKYEAYAAAMHQGNSLDGGHYVALTRNPDANTTSETKRWHVFNDRQVSPGNFKDLENRGFVVAVLFLKRKS
jgi:ubiquitin carboxyl-terminal hydrolase 8